MNKGPLVCCFACLVLAGQARGQPPAALPDPRPSPPPARAASLPLRPEVPLTPQIPPFGEGPAIPGLGNPGPGSWYVSTEADFLLRFTQGERPSRVASLSGPASLSIPVALDKTDRQGPPMPGGRFAIGVWTADYDPLLVADVCLPCRGAEVVGYFLGERSVSFAGGVVVPGLGVSNLVGRASFDLWGLEANVRSNVYSDPPSQLLRIDFSGGFRYLHLDGDVTVARRTVFAPDLSNFPTFAPLAGNQIDQVASYRARNQFYGGQFGLRTQIFAHGVVFGSDFKLALGFNHQELNIDGQVRAALPLPATLSGPFPADRGSFSRDKFSYVPQLDLYLTLPLRHNLAARFGYSLLYWSAVARSADQIELSGALGGVEVFRDRGLFVHGLNCGLQWSF